MTDSTQLFFGRTLRHIQNLRKLQAAREAKADERDALVSIMYSDPANELQRIELEQARLELEQQRQELETTRAEASQANKDALADMASAGIEAEQEYR